MLRASGFSGPEVNLLMRYKDMRASMTYLFLGHNALGLSGGQLVTTVSVQAPGGIIPIEWRDGGEVVLTGRAEVVYSGEWLLE